MESIKDLKYIYLYCNHGELTHINEAIKGVNYFKLNEPDIHYIVREGAINRKHFSIKNNNAKGQAVQSDSGIESVEHYNAKMKIVYERSYFDTIFNKTIKFDNVIPEEKHGGRVPDLSCYIDGGLILLIEISKTNPKTKEDLEQLEKIGVPLVEINTEDNEQCRHLILPKILASNAEEYREIIRRDIRAREKSERAPQLREEAQDIESSIKKHEARIIKYRAIKKQSDGIGREIDLEKDIRRVRGLIAQEENRSRQARTICERGF